MQIYWLYGRYEFSLKEYESDLCERIVQCVEEYNGIRNTMSGRNLVSRGKDDNEIIIPTFSLSQHYGDTVKTIRTAKIITYRYSVSELPELKPGTSLTEEQKNRVIDIIQKRKDTPVDSVVFDASGAKDENEAWKSSINVRIEQKSPFTVEGIDSVLVKSGIKAEISLAECDTAVWETKRIYQISAFSPAVKLSVPYSQLEGLTVTFVSKINPFDILPGMWRTLIVSLLISALLIVCLVLQFSTVLKLSRLDKLRNSFITTMIHELKRPLSTLKMCVSGLDNERMIENRAVKKELLAETRNSLDNLAAYFSKLRDITFNSVEQIPLNIRNINLRDLFEVVDDAVIRPSGKNVTMCNDIAPDIIVSADRSHLYNILVNLVENAVKYSGPEVKINAEASRGEGLIEVRIRDNGNGISSADLKHIFKRFYRGKALAGEQPGMGLGLAYVKLLVEAHGGEIYVESALGVGTYFTIKLPQ